MDAPCRCRAESFAGCVLVPKLQFGNAIALETPFLFFRYAPAALRGFAKEQDGVADILHCPAGRDPIFSLILQFPALSPSIIELDENFSSNSR